MDRSKWTDIRWAQKASEARVILEKEPHLLTDAQIQMLDDIDDGGPLYRRQRSAAQLAKLPKPQPMTAATSGGVTALQVKNAIAKVYETVGEVLAEQFKAERAMWQAAVAALEASKTALESKVSAFEQRQQPGVKWAGPHEVGKSYEVGELVQKSGGLWLCTESTRLSPGGNTAWVLALRRGKDL